MPDASARKRESAEEERLRAQAAAEANLAAEAEAGLLRRRDDPTAVEALVRHNLDVVVEQADAHARRGLAFGDLYQEGTVGLLEAIRVYDGAGAFRDFARLHVGLQMDALLEAEEQARREDREMVADTQALELAQVEMARRLRRDPTDAELAGALKWDRARLRRVQQNLDLARERNDELTLEYLDEADVELLDTMDIEEPDPRRRLPGAGPDE